VRVTLRKNGVVLKFKSFLLCYVTMLKRILHPTRVRSSDSSSSSDDTTSEVFDDSLDDVTYEPKSDEEVGSSSSSEDNSRTRMQEKTNSMLLHGQLYSSLESKNSKQSTQDVSITEIPGKQRGFGIERVHQLHVCADDVNMIEENPQTIRENTGILLEGSKDKSFEVNPEKTKYMIMSRYQNIVRNGNINIGNTVYPLKRWKNSYILE
ncbi:hypothetical protein ANN_06809, partial [Periplaneta americana]